MNQTTVKRMRLALANSFIISLLVISSIYGVIYITSEHAEGKSRWKIETVDDSGDVGRYNSITLDSDNNPHISYLGNSTLKYAKWDGKSWNIETVDSGYRHTGSFSSIALDSNDRPHIGYFGITVGDLKYAKFIDNEWEIQTVDSCGTVGRHVSLALDSDDNPHMSYHHQYEYYDGGVNTTNDLKYARWTGSQWELETVDGPGNVGYHTSIALDSDDYPHISYESNNTLKYAKWNGYSWDIETIEDPGYMYSTSIALDSNDRPYISYSGNFSLKYAEYTGANWHIETVYSIPGWGVGEGTSIALDQNDNPHISCRGRDQKHDNAIIYVKWNGNKWINETVAVGGSDTSITLDSNDNPHISYWDWNRENGYLKYATLVEDNGTLSYLWILPILIIGVAVAIIVVPVVKKYLSKE